MENLLYRLCNTVGISGSENDVAELSMNLLSKFGNTTIQNDGSVICVMGRPDAKKTILFDAHIDQIGLVVTYITENGFLKVSACGGVDKRLLPGSIVTVHGNKNFTGIICSIPPHLNSTLGKNDFQNVDDIYIDLGTDKNIIKNNVNIGDKVSFYSEPGKLLNNRIASSCLDDRAGVAVLIKLAEKLYNIDINTKVFILLSSQEETGCLGARVSSYKCDPDEAIAIDVSFAKQPCLGDDKYSTLGNGGMIGIAPILSNSITNTLISIAKKHKIPYQLEVMGGKSGTNADVIATTKCGVKCGLVSIPQRYMHSAVEVVDINDLNNTVDLLFQYVISGGAK